jgi:quercetin dioxygenase-like cupin family protein
LSDVVIARSGEGTRVHAFGSDMLFALTAEQTAGVLSLGLAVVPAGHGPPLHVHDNDDELFLVLEGEYRFVVNGEFYDAEAGSAVFLPRGTEHTFTVVGDKPGKHWALVTPGGFDRFYSRCGEVFGIPGPPDFAKINAIAAEHGYHFLPASKQE